MSLVVCICFILAVHESNSSFHHLCILQLEVMLEDNLTLPSNGKLYSKVLSWVQRSLWENGDQLERLMEEVSTRAHSLRGRSSFPLHPFPSFPLSFFDVKKSLTGCDRNGMQVSCCNVRTVLFVPLICWGFCSKKICTPEPYYKLEVSWKRAAVWVFFFCLFVFLVTTVLLGMWLVFIQPRLCITVLFFYETNTGYQRSDPWFCCLTATWLSEQVCLLLQH